MKISGILVIVSPPRVESMVEQLNGMDGIDVHHIEATTGRIVITQEAATINDEVDGLKRIRALPGIILAEMSYHNFEEDQQLVDAIPADLDDDDNIPAFLNE